MSDPHDPAHPDPVTLARDWRVIVDSELAALAADREAAETLAALAAFWARVMALLAAGFHADDPAATPPPSSGADAPARPAPAAAAPGAGDADHDRLARRVAELEARLAELERNHGTGGDDARHPGRRAGSSGRTVLASGRRPRRQP